MNRMNERTEWMNELNVYCTYSTYMMVHAMDHAMMTNINVNRNMAQSLFPLFFKLLLLLPTITLMISKIFKTTKRSL